MKRFQASYIGPDLALHAAPETFPTELDADGWLSHERRIIDRGDWSPPAEREAAAQAEAEREGLTVRDLSERWLSNGHLKESTVQSHGRMMDRRVLSTSLADEPVVEVTRTRINEWWREVNTRWPDTAPTNSYSYKRLRTCFQFAVDELEVIASNPVNVKGAGVPPRPKTRDHDLITLQQARDMADGMNERFKAPVEVLLWTGVRIGELLELRRKDVRGLSGDGPVTLRIRRNVQRLKSAETGKQVMVPFGTPKTEAANRDVVVPAAVVASLRKHCRKHVAPCAESLIVTTEKGKPMMDTSFRSALKLGTRAAGREDVTPHDCRRFYATTMVSHGVNVEDVRRLMGHENTDQVMEYMRSASGYEQDAAEVLSRVMNSVVPGATEQYGDQGDGKGSNDE